MSGGHFSDDGRSSPVSKKAIAHRSETMGTSDRSLNFLMKYNKRKFKQEEKRKMSGGHFSDDGRSSPVSKKAIAHRSETMGTSDRSLNFLMKYNKRKFKQEEKRKMSGGHFSDDGRSSPVSKKAIAHRSETMGTSDRSLNFLMKYNKYEFKQEDPYCLLFNKFINKTPYNFLCTN